MFKEVIKRQKNEKRVLDKNGFTLMELVVVVVIVGILAGIALPRYNRVVERSRTTEAMSTLGSILNGQKRYALEYDAYAGSLGALDVNVTNPGRFFSYTLLGGNPLATPGENIARATRTGSGSYAGSTITIDEDGNFTSYL